MPLLSEDEFINICKNYGLVVKSNMFGYTHAYKNGINEAVAAYVKTDPGFIKFWTEIATDEINSDYVCTFCSGDVPEIDLNNNCLTKDFVLSEIKMNLEKFNENYKTFIKKRRLKKIDGL